MVALPAWPVGGAWLGDAAYCDAVAAGTEGLAVDMLLHLKELNRC